MLKSAIALDVASTTGWACWKAGDEWPSYGSIKFQTPDLGERAKMFSDWLISIVVAEKITDIAIESPIQPIIGGTQLDILIWLYGCFLRVLEISSRRQINVHPVTTTQWRSWFLGVTQAPRSLDKSRRRTWLKRRCVDECKARGYAPNNDNEADALAILDYIRSQNDMAYARSSTPMLAKVVL